MATKNNFFEEKEFVNGMQKSVADEQACIEALTHDSRLTQAAAARFLDVDAEHFSRLREIRPGPVDISPTSNHASLYLMENLQPWAQAVRIGAPVLKSYGKK